MNNPHADGTAEDLIRSFIQIGCAENHAKTILEKTEAELNNGIITDQDEIQDAVEKFQDTLEEVNSLANLRRRMMLRLFEMYDGDKDYWCMVKHNGIAAYTAFEAYQATDDDPEMLEIALEANRRFINSLSRFIGADIKECASCMSDYLKAKGE